MTIYAFNESMTDHMVIGSTCFQIFNEHGRFNSGLHHVKLWPFYALDERTSCVGEFNGVMGSNDKTNIKDVASLTFALQDFNMPMFASVRDNYIMKEKYGFPEIFQCSTDAEWNLKPQTEDLANLQFLLNSDPLSRMKFT